MSRQYLSPLRISAFLAGSMLIASTLACGGQIPVSGKINFSGALPPPPPPPPKPVKKAPPPRVEVRDNKIEIHEKIHFEKAKATIMEDSFGLMGEIAQVLKDNPHILLVSIEGHTDSDGSDKYNKKLSDDRAHSVRTWLVDNGVDEARLDAKGFGEEAPIADNETPEGKEKNRRVEFNIVKQDVTQKKVEIDHTGKEKTLSEKTTTNDESAKSADSKSEPNVSKTPGLTKKK